MHQEVALVARQPSSKINICSEHLCQVQPPPLALIVLVLLKILTVLLVFFILINLFLGSGPRVCNEMISNTRGTDPGEEALEHLVPSFMPLLPPVILEEVADFYDTYEKALLMKTLIHNIEVPQ